MSLVGFRSKNHPQQTRKRGPDHGVDERITPDEIYLPLHSTHGFTLDVAASERNTRCAKFFDLKSDGLVQSWRGEVVWCNPPYSNIGAWVEKAFLETRKSRGCAKVVMLLPNNRSEQRWWQSWIEPVRDRGRGVTTINLAGRPRFGWPIDRHVPPKGDRPPFGLTVVIIEARP
jgi:phage N-6-adenine-methyltransferase